jgi:hypothetical protein
VTLLAFKACGASGNRRSVGSTPTHFRQLRFYFLRAAIALFSSSYTSKTVSSFVI